MKISKELHRVGTRMIIGPKVPIESVIRAWSPSGDYVEVGVKLPPDVWSYSWEPTQSIEVLEFLFIPEEPRAFPAFNMNGG